MDPASSGFIGRMVAGRYRILAKLGEGGMGAVYRAEQISLKRIVALKVLRAELSAEPGLVRRFNTEAELAAKLSHPNTVTLFDFGQDADGALFIAMECLEGRSLREVLSREGPLAPGRALAICEQLCASLADAHSHGIIHRDLKPDNVMLLQRGRLSDVVRVLDFGIAKLRDEQGDISNRPMTRAGDLLGTPQYMAPEQIRGETVDARTDVYALGAMLYEMITGRLPFEGPSLMSILSKHLTEVPVPPRERRPDLRITPSLSHLVMEALDKDPARRPPSMDAFADRLARLVLEVGPRTDQMAGSGFPGGGGFLPAPALPLPDSPPPGVPLLRTPLPGAIPSPVGHGRPMPATPAPFPSPPYEQHMPPVSPGYPSPPPQQVGRVPTTPVPGHPSPPPQQVGRVPTTPVPGYPSPPPQQMGRMPTTPVPGYPSPPPQQMGRVPTTPVPGYPSPPPGYMPSPRSPSPFPPPGPGDFGQYAAAGAAPFLGAGSAARSARAATSASSGAGRTGLWIGSGLLVAAACVALFLAMRGGGDSGGGGGVAGPGNQPQAPDGPAAQPGGSDVVAPDFQVQPGRKLYGGDDAPQPQDVQAGQGAWDGGWWKDASGALALDIPRGFSVVGAGAAAIFTGQCGSSPCTITAVSSPTYGVQMDDAMVAQALSQLPSSVAGDQVGGASTIRVQGHDGYSVVVDVDSSGQPMRGQLVVFAGSGSLSFIAIQAPRAAFDQTAGFRSSFFEKRVRVH
jgi:serine/threonine protein kinase